MRIFKRLKLILALCLGIVTVLFFALSPSHAQTALPSIVVDANNGKVLFANRADEVRAPASITKVMTLYLVFDALQTGRISWDTQMPVSKVAASRPRMKLDVPAGSTINVRDAVNALVISSANDISVVFAEYLAGSEANFAKVMTLKARSLGMRNTSFKNASGLTQKGHVSTARDIALMSIAIQEHFPQYYSLFSQRQFKYRGRTIKGHNRILDRLDGANGLKTGFTNAAGFTITSTISRGNRKIVVVVLGGKTTRNRDDQVVLLTERYFSKASRFNRKGVFKKWTIAQSVWRGQPLPNSVPAIAVAQAPDTLVNAPVPLVKPNMNGTVSPYQTFNIAQSKPETNRSSDNLQTASIHAPVTSVVPVRRPAKSIGQEDTSTRVMAYADYQSNNAVGALENQFSSNEQINGNITAGNTAYVVQVAALHDVQSANNFLNDVKNALNDKSYSALGFVESATVNKTNVYRVRFGSFNDQASAISLCNDIKARAFSCFVSSQ
ncbi:D-alanyl-D-alanine carboxypeptidase [Bartonella tamiae]|uniref:SPOR domain-containing protein n=1 Tax=Bartonella tamiae Th239 TaxID=1094558 RepID=J0QY88_9HYPH|nr:D-alanyl-D-alanine carboxypeptidase [Bartonella tamiae]EJF91061.1 hypothetical protein ME5_00393 [Bartonella tamiae Th239]EJF93274.1 hypothetical protein MEG_01488 [Bartonella tamiae Th307]